MNLRVTSIADRGVPNKERIEITVTAPADLKYYQIAEGTFLPGSAVAAGALNVYWFPSRQVSAGDRIVLYTGPGTDLSVPFLAKPGNHIHTLHWNQKITLFQRPGSTAILFEVATWETAGPLFSFK